MAKEFFKDSDLGKRVELEFNPLKVDEQFYVSEPGYVKIPYDAIERYVFLVKFKDIPYIRDTSPTLPGLNAIHIAKVLGASSEKIDGTIIELADDYIKIQKYPLPNRDFHGPLDK